MTDASHSPDLTQDAAEAPRSALIGLRGVSGNAVEILSGLADSLRRNILLGLMVMVMIGFFLNFTIFEISLIAMLAYIALLAVASITDS